MNTVTLMLVIMTGVATDGSAILHESPAILTTSIDDCINAGMHLNKNPSVVGKVVKWQCIDHTRNITISINKHQDRVE
jgi:hypothetical protein